jgi:hypothetical protein
MSQDVFDDRIAFLLSTRSNREIAKLLHVGQDRVRAVRIAQSDHMQILYQMGRLTNVTHQTKQTVIELTPQHPSSADLQIAQIISETSEILANCHP